MIPEILNIGSKILDKIFPDKTEAEKAKLELLKLQQDGQLKELEISVSTIIEEARSQDKWTSRARPCFLYVIYLMVLAAIPMGIISVMSPSTANGIINGVNAWLKAIPDDLWWLFGAGYLGYTGARSFDKKRKK